MHYKQCVLRVGDRIFKTTTKQDKSTQLDEIAKVFSGEGPTDEDLLFFRSTKQKKMRASCRVGIYIRLF